MSVYALGELVPDIHPDAYVHPGATVIGQVSIGAEATIWPGVVLRGDYGRIEIGARTSVQDGTVVHATHELPTIIGSDCVIGHLAHLEGCVVADHSLIGSGSVVLHRCRVGPDSLVGANAVVTNGTERASWRDGSGCSSPDPTRRRQAWIIRSHRGRLRGQWSSLPCRTTPA